MTRAALEVDILVGSKWSSRFDTPQHTITVTDFDPHAKDRPVSFRLTYDPGFGMWMPENEFRDDYDPITPTDEGGIAP